MYLNKETFAAAYEHLPHPNLYLALEAAAPFIAAQALRDAAESLDEAAMKFPIDTDEDDVAGAAIEMGGHCVDWIHNRANNIEAGI